MAGVATPLLIPLFIFIPMATGGLGVEGFDLSGTAHLPWTPVVLVAIVFGLNSTSAIPSSAISREGPWFWISQSLPVAPRVQVHAKVLHSLVFNALNLIIVVAAAAWLGLATPRNLAFLLTGGLLVSGLAGYIGLLIDVLKPTLHWTDPQQAMKGNINSLIALLVNLAVTGVTAGAAALLYLTARPFFLPGLLVVLAVEVWGAAQAAGALADVRYTQYEL